jgi:hypothetical protein
MVRESQGRVFLRVAAKVLRWMALDRDDCRVTGHYDLKRRSLRGLSSQATAFQAVVFPTRTTSLGRRDSGDELWRAGMTKWAGLFCKNMTDILFAAQIAKGRQMC